MRRMQTGRYQTTNYGAEQVRSFIPAPLPPEPPISFDGSLQQSFENALLALGRLDSISLLLPDPTLFIYSYVRKEAVLSSQIEGTQSSISDLMRFEYTRAPGAPFGDVVEVSNYVAALEHGLRRLRDGFPFSNRLIREIHRVLLTAGRGSKLTPGEFRKSQNWIGGARPGNAVYVPPPHTELDACMGAFERFCHATDDGLPMLARIGMAHAQFETLHPFLDGNGRTGRLLITFLLCNAKILQEPLLYLSLYLKRNREAYYGLLQEVRLTGDWEKWLEFFFEGVRETAEGAVSTQRRLTDLFDKDNGAIVNKGVRTSSVLRVHRALMTQPILSLAEVQRQTQMAFSTASASMGALVDMGIAREITGRDRNRLFAYGDYIEILNEGTEL